MGKKQPKPLPKREYKAVQIYGTIGTPFDMGLTASLNALCVDGWEFVQMSGNIVILRREQ